MLSDICIDGLPSTQELWAIKNIDNVSTNEINKISVKLVKVEHHEDLHRFREEIQVQECLVPVRKLSVLRIGQIYQNKMCVGDLPTESATLNGSVEDFVKFNRFSDEAETTNSLLSKLLTPLRSWVETLKQQFHPTESGVKLSFDSSNYFVYFDQRSDIKCYFPASLLIQTFYAPSDKFVSALVEESWTGGGRETLIERVDNDGTLVIHGDVDEEFVPFIALLTTTEAGVKGASYIRSSLLNSFRQNQLQGYGVLDCIFPFSSTTEMTLEIEAIELLDTKIKSYLITDITAASWHFPIIGPISWKRTVQHEFIKNKGRYDPSKAPRYRKFSRFRHSKESSVKKERPNPSIGQKEVIKKGTFVWLSPPVVIKVETPIERLVKRRKVESSVEEKTNLSLEDTTQATSSSVKGKATRVLKKENALFPSHKNNEFAQLNVLLEYLKSNNKIDEFYSINAGGLTHIKGGYSVFPVRQLTEEEIKTKPANKYWHIANFSDSSPRMIYPVGILIKDKSFIWFEVQKRATTHKYLIVETSGYSEEQIKTLLVNVANSATSTNGIWHKSDLQESYNLILVKHYEKKVTGDVKVDAMNQSDNSKELDYEKIYRLGIKKLM